MSERLILNADIDGTLDVAGVTNKVTVLADLGADNASNLLTGTVAAARLGIGSGGATKFLREDGTWQTAAGAGIPGGNPGQVQFNFDGTLFGGSVDFTFDELTQLLTVTNFTVPGNLTVGAGGVASFADGAVATNLVAKGEPDIAKAGTVSVTIGTATVTGVATTFLADFPDGSAIKIADEVFTVSGTPASDTALTLSANHAAGAAGVVAYAQGNLWEVLNPGGDLKVFVDKDGVFEATVARFPILELKDLTGLQVRAIQMISAQTDIRALSLSLPDADMTLTLTGDLIRVGAHSLTLTTTGVTNVTLPTSGTLSTFDPASPGPIGGTTPGTGAFTTLNASGVVTVGADTFLSRDAAATLQMGADAGTPVNQTLKAHDWTSGGTGIGAALTVKGGAGTAATKAGTIIFNGGTATAGGSLVFQTAVTGTLADQLTISADGTIVATPGTNLIEQRNGTTAQAFNIYNTYANGGVDYERLGIRWSGNIGILGVQNSGSGTLRNLVVAGASVQIGLNGGNGWTFNSSKHLLADTDNASDIGASAASRPRSIYFGTSLFRGATKILGAQEAAVADATDNPSAITQLNALLARLRTHGLIAT